MKKSIKVLITGAVLFFGGLAAGFIVTLFGMIRSFNAISDSGAAPPPQQVAETIGNSMVAMSISMSVSFLGLCLVIWGAIAHVAGRKRCNHAESQLAERNPPGPQSGRVANP